MSNNRSLGFFLLLWILTTNVASGQSGANSIFSRFGIGDLNGSNFVHNEFMGGIGSAYVDANHINIKNPASYGFLRATAFDIGVSIDRTNISDQQFESTIWSGNLDYISLAFPLRNPLNEAFDREAKNFWLGMNFSLLPYSFVNYSITTSNVNDELGVHQSNFRGEGGTYKVHWGNSIRYKNFSFGLNIGYLFGKIQNEVNTILPERPSSFSNNFFTNYNVRGFIWEGGLLYRHVINQKKIDNQSATQREILTLGVRGTASNEYQSTINRVRTNRRILLIGGEIDTLLFEQDAAGIVKLPTEIGFGVNYAIEGKLSLELDYAFSKWSSYVNDANPAELSDTYELNLGGYYRPNYKSFKFRNRIYYRFGAFVRQDARSINQNDITNYGVTFGVGLPFVYQRKISHINLGLSLGRRGQTDALSETFVKLGIGLTFNDDEWFIERKYN